MFDVRSPRGAGNFCVINFARANPRRFLTQLVPIKEAAAD
jgi:hypothetical protein